MSSEIEGLKQLKKEVDESNRHLTEIKTNINFHLNQTNEHLHYMRDIMKILSLPLLAAIALFIYTLISDDYNITRHWSLVDDMNGDGKETVIDLWLSFHWILFYPGDWLIQYFSDSSFGRYWELSNADYGGFLSGTLSFTIIFGPLSFLIMKIDEYTNPQGGYYNSLIQKFFMPILIICIVNFGIFVYLLIFAGLSELFFGIFK